MINKPIETYKDMRRAQNTYKFANYFPEMDNGTLNFIFDFVEDEKNKVVGEHEKITFYVSNKVVRPSRRRWMPPRQKPSRKSTCIRV